MSRKGTLHADYAQKVYESNRKRSVKKSSLTKELKEKILHYHHQKFSPEMMVKAKGGCSSENFIHLLLDPSWNIGIDQTEPALS